MHQDGDELVVADPGFGSSKTSIVVTERLHEQDKIRVLYAKEFDRPNPQDIGDLCFDLHKEYQNTSFVDGVNRERTSTSRWQINCFKELAKINKPSKE